jgi:hypothetical protein
LNVQDADATLILSHGPLSGGSKFTEVMARSLGKPVWHVDLDATGSSWRRARSRRSVVLASCPTSPVTRRSGQAVAKINITRHLTLNNRRR